MLIRPMKLEALVKMGVQVKDISCGVKHTALVTHDSHLICFGSNLYGQCGESQESIRQTFEHTNLAMMGLIKLTPEQA